MVIIGYGPYQNYRLQEVPDDLLSELAQRYELSYEAQKHADSDDLQITIAIHEEVNRRHRGGSIVPREPTARELATEIVKKGYQHLCKRYHPDRGGSNGAQKTLNAVRRQLQEACDQVGENWPEDALKIPAPRRAAAVVGSSPISDEDIPF